ncbi:hypothetical protein PUMCH_001036 [Australozyma saopauloensis]|uniref:Uncharacterized protein n=1 Tax=Australozyma saopauloensis TaxID=291208 RepID=A0AAX4H7T4_9ASCO|nr:hypothetical protein PUMCH_001036 [[Candida] saopauloensis]
MNFHQVSFQFTMKLLFLAAYAVAFFQPFKDIKQNGIDPNPDGILWSQDAKNEMVGFGNFVASLSKAKVNPHAIICDTGLVFADQIPSYEEMVKTGSVNGQENGKFESFGLTATEMYHVANYIQDFKKTFEDEGKSANIILCETEFPAFVVGYQAKTTIAENANGTENTTVAENFEKRDDQVRKFRSKSDIYDMIVKLRQMHKHSRNH